MKDITVEVSHDGRTVWDPEKKEFTNPRITVWRQQYNGSFPKSHVFPVNVSNGQYVKVSLEGDNKVLSLAEVEVYGYNYGT